MATQATVLCVSFLLCHSPQSLRVKSCASKILWAEVPYQKNIYLNECEVQKKSLPSLQRFNLSADHLCTLPESFFHQTNDCIRVYLEGNGMTRITGYFLEKANLSAVIVNCQCEFSRTTKNSTCKGKRMGVSLRTCGQDAGPYIAGAGTLLLLLALGGLGLAWSWKHCRSARLNFRRFQRAPGGPDTHTKAPDPGNPGGHAAPTGSASVASGEQGWPPDPEASANSYENIQAGPLRPEDGVGPELYENISLPSCSDTLYSNVAQSDYCSFRKPHTAGPPPLPEDEIYILPD